MPKRDKTTNPPAETQDDNNEVFLSLLDDYNEWLEIQTAAAPDPGEERARLLEDLLVPIRSSISSALASRYSTLADDTPDRRLRVGAKASIRIKKLDRYLPVTITATGWNAHGEIYHTADHATEPWAVELKAEQFMPGWPGGGIRQPADGDVTARAREAFLEAGVLRIAAIPTQLARGIANSLWPRLKAERWQEHTCTRDLAAYNPTNREQSGSNGFRTTPSAVTSVIQHHEQWIDAMLYAKEWFGDDGLPPENYAILLTREAYDDALGSLSGNARFALLAAYRARVSAPFNQQPNRHGVLRLRRCNYDPAITPEAGSALEAIARAAYACPVSEEAVEAFHSGDIAVFPDMLSSVPRPVSHAFRRG